MRSTMRSGLGGNARSPRWSTSTKRSWKVRNYLVHCLAEGVTGRSQVPVRAYGGLASLWCTDTDCRLTVRSFL